MSYYMEKIATLKEMWLKNEIENLKKQGISKADIAEKLGVKPQYINNIVNGGRGITDIFLDKFIEAFKINRFDLLNVAQVEELSPRATGVPYYDVDFCGGFDFILNDQTRLPAGYINIPQYNKADSWANITGHSMEPLISNGDIIALRKVEDWRTYMLYGEVYGIMTNEWRTVKRVRKSQNPDNIILEPINKEYDEQEIPKSIITGVWQILGCAKKFF